MTELPETATNRHIAVVNAFLDAMSADRALAPNSIAAYRRDLEAASRALKTRGTSLTICDGDYVGRYECRYVTRLRFNDR